MARRTDHGLHAQLATTIVVLVAFIKVRFIGLYFMELREAPVALRLVFEGYCAVVCAVVISCTSLVAGSPRIDLKLLQPSAGRAPAPAPDCGKGLTSTSRLARIISEFTLRLGRRLADPAASSTATAAPTALARIDVDTHNLVFDAQVKPYLTKRWQRYMDDFGLRQQAAYGLAVGQHPWRRGLMLGVPRASLRSRPRVLLSAAARGAPDRPGHPQPDATNLLSHDGPGFAERAHRRDRAGRKRLRT